MHISHRQVVASSKDLIQFFQVPSVGDKVDFGNAVPDRRGDNPALILFCLAAKSALSPPSQCRPIGPLVVSPMTTASGFMA